MPILYSPSPYAQHCDEESLTEPEHADSCDINIMVSRAARGLDIRGNAITPQYGHDDLTMDALQFRIQKQKIENELAEAAEKHEFQEEEFKLIPESMKNKFKFKKAQKKDDKQLNEQSQNPEPTKNETNNDSKN